MLLTPFSRRTDHPRAALRSCRRLVGVWSPHLRDAARSITLPRRRRGRDLRRDSRGRAAVPHPHAQGQCLDLAEGESSNKPTDELAADLSPSQLLTRDPVRRLGSGEADAAEIKSHLFFKDTNWDDIFHKRVPSPFFPNIVRSLLASSLPRFLNLTLTLSAISCTASTTVLGDRYIQLRLRVHERTADSYARPLDSFGAGSGRVCWFLVCRSPSLRSHRKGC